MDGGRTVTDGEPTACWSLNRSDDDCMFETPPEIDITFTAPYTATGLTFTFSPSTGQYCSKLRVRWYSGTTLLADTTAEPDDPQWVLTQTVESFDRINIQLLATNHPGHFAKLTQLRIGQLITLDETELTRVQYLAEVDPGMTELSVDEFIEFNDRHRSNTHRRTPEQLSCTWMAVCGPHTTYAPRPGKARTSTLSPLNPSSGGWTTTSSGASTKPSLWQLC